MSAQIVDINGQDLTQFADAINQLAQGRSNAVGSFILTANAASTVVTAMNCGAASTPLYTPTSANAATEVGNGTIYVSAIANGSFTVAHANNAQTDRTFRYACFG